MSDIDKKHDESDLDIFIPYLIGALSAYDILDMNILIVCIRAAYNNFKKERKLTCYDRS